MLFIVAGMLIHTFNSFQDFRQFGGGRVSLPSRSVLATVAQARLMGLPFFSAHFTKEPILEACLARLVREEGILFRAANLTITLAFFVRVLLTVVYSTRFTLKALLIPPLGNPLSNLGETSAIPSLPP